jgi:hypothetical protein
MLAFGFAFEFEMVFVLEFGFDLEFGSVSESALELDKLRK